MLQLRESVSEESQNVLNSLDSNIQEKGKLPMSMMWLTIIEYSFEDITK